MRLSWPIAFTKGTWTLHFVNGRISTLLYSELLLPLFCGMGWMVP